MAEGQRNHALWNPVLCHIMTCVMSIVVHCSLVRLLHPMCLISGSTVLMGYSEVIITHCIASWSPKLWCGRSGWSLSPLCIILPNYDVWARLPVLSLSNISSAGLSVWKHTFEQSTLGPLISTLRNFNLVSRSTLVTYVWSDVFFLIFWESVIIYLSCSCWGFSHSQSTMLFVFLLCVCWVTCYH